MSLFSICAVTDTLIEEEDLPEGHQGRRPRWLEIGLRISYGAVPWRAIAMCHCHLTLVPGN